MICINVMTAELRNIVRSHAWRLANLERARDNVKAWKKANADRVYASNKDYRKANPDKVQGYGKKWDKKNPEKKNSYSRAWKKRNPEKVSELRRRWGKKHPDQNKSYRRLRRARIKGAGGSFTAEQFKALGDMCLCCGRNESELVLIGLSLVPDHVIPISRGGSNDIGNIQPLCQGRGGCNNKKHAKTIDYRGTAGRLEKVV